MILCQLIIRIMNKRNFRTVTDTESPAVPHFKSEEDFSIEIKNDPNNKLDSKYCSLVASKITVEGKQVDHFELSIDIKQAIADGKIEAGNDLCVNYTAVLNAKADFYIIGEGKNTNTAYLEYSNNPNGEGTGKTPESSVHAWTFAMVVSKIDGTTKAPLTGAKFVLSRRANVINLRRFNIS